MTIPAEFKMPDFSESAVESQWHKTQFEKVLKPVGGALGPLHAEFRVHKEYSGAESMEQDVEVHKEVEICLIKTDKFSAVPLRVGKKGTKVNDPMVIKATIDRIYENEEVPIEERHKVAKRLEKMGLTRGAVRSELTREQEIKLAALYERFKTQQNTTDTDVFKWDAITDGERGMLASQNIFTVEQLYYTPQEQRYRLGPGGEELWDRARRFMKAREAKEANDERSKELALLREEREKQNKRLQEMEEKYFQMQEQIAAMSGGQEDKPRRGRPRKEETISE